MIITGTREASAFASDWTQFKKQNKNQKTTSHSPQKKPHNRPKHCSTWLIWIDGRVKEQKRVEKSELIFSSNGSKCMGRKEERQTKAKKIWSSDCLVFQSFFQDVLETLLCISTVFGNEYFFSEIWLSHGRAVKYRIFCLLAADFWLSTFLLVQVFLYEYSYLSSKQGQQIESWRESQHSPKLCQ